MKNIEKYKEIVLKHLSQCDIETDIRKQGGKAAIDCPHTSCEECKEKFFKWLLEEYKAPILDEVEKEYLKSVIKPFRNHVISIRKCFNGCDYRIVISLDHLENLARLPHFSLSSKMYNGMDSDKWYSLKELGL